MKRMIRLMAVTVALGGVVFISACGSDDADPVASLVNRFAEVTTLVTSATGLKDAKIPAMFDDAFKDGGYVKSALAADLQAESAALAANPDQSLFPMAAFKDVTVTGCDGNICTLTGKLVNSDVDATEVSFTTKVKSVSGDYYFYGDQQAS
jgi:hypothetical protein